MLYEEIITDYIDSPGGKIPLVSPKWIFRDYLGAITVRLGISRKSYAIQSGLYAIGQPDENAPVLVTANYKLSFDTLRKELNGIDAWIMVLDTRGINVWCAAGKGTFGTEELILKIQSTELEKIVKHRYVIVPQLGAPGIAAHIVKMATGFKVIYGPIRAADIPEFLQNGNKATDAMRKVHFNLLDRLLVIPVEVVTGFKYLLIVAIIFLTLTALIISGFDWQKFLESGSITIVSLGLAYASGTILTPIFLPYLPARAFSMKGFLINLIPFALFWLLSSGFSNISTPEKISWFFLTSAIASFLAMNFTGATPYTSLSGVKKEMRVAVPLQIASLVVGFGGWLITNLI